MKMTYSHFVVLIYGAILLSVSFALPVKDNESPGADHVLYPSVSSVALPVFENEDDISAVTSAENLQVVDLVDPEENKVDDPILSAVQVETKVQATSPAQWLAYHNKYRCMQGLNDLRWSDGLAAAAQRWASRGKWGHGTGSDSPYKQTPSGGENLGAGGDAEGTVERWYDEIKDCDWSTGCQKPTTVGKMVGHFTAMAWKNTNTLGCATATITEGNMKGYPYFVCRYGDTPPNYGGQYKTNVNRAVKSASQCVTRPACKDQNPNCGGWKDSYCPNQGNKGHPYVIKHCKRTCGLCGRAVPVPVPIPVTRAPVSVVTWPPASPSSCVDKRAGILCGIWKRRGYCTSGRYVSFMASYCAKTCGKC